MAGVFSSGGAKVDTPAATSLRVQTSVEGKPRPIGWGAARLAGNLIDYGDFVAVAKPQQRGGKGGAGNGGSSGQFTYSAAVIIALCEGPISSWGYLFNANDAIAYSKLNLTTFNGSYSQAPWGYTTTNHVANARNYHGLAYMAAGPMPLDTSPSLPNLTVEIVFGTYADGVSGTPDANPATVVIDYLTQPDWGIGFPSAFVAALTVYRNYCRSIGLVVSPVLVAQAEGRTFLNDLLAATNSEAVWSNGVLDVVPYGDVATSGNGASYTPPSVAQYSLSDIDFKPLQGGNAASKGGGAGVGPIAVSLNDDPVDHPNSWSVEYLERGNAYNPTVVTVQDDAAIATYGLRTAPKQTLHFFCASFAATMSAELTKGRAQPAASYAFTVGQEYILLDPMDIIEINDPNLGYSQKWVRIREITENADNTLTIQAEEYLAGTGGAPAHSMQVGAGFSAAYNAQPTAPFSTVVWEPSYTLAGGLEIWIAASGGADFGGAEIYVSSDNSTFAQIGTLAGPSRIGDLTASLAATTASVPGPTIDTVHTLSVDMSSSGQQLTGGTHTDAVEANTLCFVASGGAGAGEYLAFSSAILGSGQTYALTYLNRGLFETSPVAHAAGAAFVRLIPDTFFRWSVTPDRIGQTFYFKVLPFNPYGGGQLGLSDVTAVAYTVVGTAFANVSAGSVSIRNPTNTQWLPIGTYNATTSTFSATTATTVTATSITGTISAAQIGSVNATAITGTISAGQIGSVSASTITGTVTATQIGSVNASVIAGTVTASQINTVTAGQITGTLTSGQIGSVAAATVTGTLSAGQIGAVNAGGITGGISAGQITSLTAGQITGTLTAGQIGSVGAASVTGTLTAGQIGSIGAVQITGTLVASQIDSIGAVQIIGSLSDAQLAAISGAKVTGTISTAVIPAGNLTGQLTYTQIASVSASTITGQVGAVQISAVNASSIVGSIAASQITSLNVSQLTGSISSSQITSITAGQVTGTLTSAQIASVAASTITGTLSAGQIGSVNASAISGGITAGQITSVAATSLTGTVTTSQIGTLQVTGAQIAGGAINASKFTIGGGSVFPDPYVDDPDYWFYPNSSTGWYIDHASGSGSLAALGLRGALTIWSGAFTGGGYAEVISKVGALAAIPGARYTLVATGFNSGNKTVGAFINFIDAAGSYISTGVYLSWPASTGASQQRGQTIAAPSNAVAMLVGVNAPSGAAWSGLAGISGFMVVPAATGEMIVDGSLTAAKLSAGFALISSAQIGTLNVDTVNVKAGALSYFAAEYNEYVWTPGSSYGADGSCTVSVTVADANEMVLIMFKTVAEYTDHATGTVTGSTGGGGSGSNGSELGGPG